MKKFSLKRLFSVLFLMTFSICAMAFPAQYTIKGTVVGRDSKTLIFVKAVDDERAKGISIPIVDNKFEYTFSADQVEAYALIFEDELNTGSWTTNHFFNDTSVVNFTLYNQEKYTDNIVEGGKLNVQLNAFTKSVRELFYKQFDKLNIRINDLLKNKDYNSPEYITIMDGLKTADAEARRKIYLKRDSLKKNNADLTTNGKLIRKESDDIWLAMNDYSYEYFKNNISLVSYFLIWRDVYGAKNNPEMQDRVNAVLPKFVKEFPNHSYSKVIVNEVEGWKKIKPGQKFIDFSAPDFAGKTYTLSALTNSKITLIDFWGSWCGPCIANTRTMAPLYDEFKNKGFNIVGIAREFGDTKNFEIAMKREKYPWLNLLELNDKNGIWNKYAISNSSGLMVLINQQGTILAVNPSAEEVRKALIKEL